MSEAESAIHAARRKTKIRIKNKRAKYHNSQRGDNVAIGIVAKTPKSCNCWMCSNQRKVFGEPFIDTRRKGAMHEEDWGV